MNSKGGTIRFADRLLAEGFSVINTDEKPNKESTEAWKRILQKSTVVAADNCYQYFMQGEKSYSLRTFPCIRPPFHNTFIEYKADNGDYHGTLFSEYSSELLNYMPGLKESAAAKHLYAADPHGEIGLILMCAASFWRAKDKSRLADALFFIIRPDGSTYDVYESKKGSRGLWADFPDSEAKERLNLMLDATYVPALLALSFMNCKNVKVANNNPEPKLSKAFNRRHGRPLLTYKTLEIEPMKRVLETEGGIERNGFKKALHICRGHFATLTRNNKGEVLEQPTRYFRDAHTRGDSSNGVVKKDYRVNAPA